MSTNATDATLRLWQGETYEATLTVYADAEGTTPLNLTTWGITDVRCDFRTSYDASTATFSSTLSGGEFTVSDPTKGVIDWEISASDMAGIPAGNYVYDVEIQNSGGKVKKIAAGTAIVRAEATK